jgi:hypothetical protein
MLGLERHVPDETQVVVRPPLTLPPDYNLMPPGTPTAVSTDHEGAQSTADASQPAAPAKKEGGGFFSFDWLFGSSDDDASKPAAPAPSTDGAQPAPPIDGTPQAPQSSAPASSSDATPPKS